MRNFRNIIIVCYKDSKRVDILLLPPRQYCPSVCPPFLSFYISIYTLKSRVILTRLSINNVYGIVLL